MSGTSRSGMPPARSEAPSLSPRPPALLPPGVGQVLEAQALPPAVLALHQRLQPLQQVLEVRPLQHEAGHLADGDHVRAARLLLEQALLAEVLLLAHAAELLALAPLGQRLHAHLPRVDDVELVPLLALPHDLLPVLEDLHAHGVHALVQLRRGQVAQQRHGLQDAVLHVAREQVLQGPQQLRELPPAQRQAGHLPPADAVGHARLVQQQGHLPEVLPAAERGQHVLLVRGRALALRHVHLPVLDDVEGVPALALPDDVLPRAEGGLRQRAGQLGDLLVLERVQDLDRLQELAALHHLAGAGGGQDAAEGAQVHAPEHAGRLRPHRGRALGVVHQRQLAEGPPGAVVADLLVVDEHLALAHLQHEELEPVVALPHHVLAGLLLRGRHRRDHVAQVLHPDLREQEVVPQRIRKKLTRRRALRVVFLLARLIGFD